MIAEISLATVATVIGMWIVGLPLLLWLEKRHRRKLDEEYRKDKKWREYWRKWGEKLDKDDE